MSATLGSREGTVPSGELQAPPGNSRRERTVMQLDAPEVIRGSLLTSEADLASEYRRRNDPYVYRSVHPADEDRFVAEGWQVHRRGKSRLRLRQGKAHDALLEDATWALLRRMRYPQMNARNFKLEYRRPDGTADAKQIDVFAKDDETVLVIECKSRADRGRKSLSKDLAETYSLQKPIGDAIRGTYGKASKLQVIWIYVTRNIVWSEPDLNRADSFNIRVVTENEFRYYDKFIRHMGPAGRFQFLAEFLHGKKIPGLENVVVPAVKGRLGKNSFYTFVIPAKHLLKIAFVNHHALNHPGGQPAYQRMVSPSRIKKIGEFILKGGYFPTNILVNFKEACRFDLLPSKEDSSENLKFGWLHLPSRYKSAWVIDGQHRLYGYSRLTDKYLQQNLFVLAFESLDITTEADLFITINNTQKKVPKTIRVALEADLKWGSPEPQERLAALASALIRKINADASGPFYQRFSTEGLEDAEGTALTIGEVSKGLVRSGLIGRVLHRSYAIGPLCGATDEETIERTRKFLNGYFAEIRDSNPARWEKGKAGAVLSNPGVRAQLLLIGEIFKYAASQRRTDPELASDGELMAEINAVISPVLEFIRGASDDEILRSFSRKFGEGGVADYFNNLCRLIHAERPDFGGPELRKWLAERDEARVERANQDVMRIDRALRDYVFDVLKRVHGVEEIKSSGEKAYWDIGIESADTKAKAYRRQQEDPLDSRRPREAYVDTIELMQIVRQKNNWEHFRSSLNIEMPEERKGKTYYLEWMEKLNKVRRIAAHPSSQRVYTEEDYNFIDWLKSKLFERLDAAKAV
jgi:DGQHR domain-containing protein